VHKFEHYLSNSVCYETYTVVTKL